MLSLQGLGEVPVIKDLDHSPWKDRLQQLQSAKTRVNEGEYKWREVVNMTDSIRVARTKLNHPPQPYDKTFRAEKEAAKKAKKLAKQTKQEGGSEQ